MRGASKSSQVMRGELEDWLRFLLKHTHRLNNYHGLLFTLIYHEGFPASKAKAQLRASSGVRREPWIRTTRAWLPPAQSGQALAEAIEILTLFKFDPCSVSVLAGNRGLGFFLRSLGEVAVVDLRTCRELSGHVGTRRLRPLRISCCSRGDHLAIAYENGEADLLRLYYSDAPDLVDQNLLRSVEYLAPEYEAPVMEFIDDQFCYQAANGEVCKLNLTSVDPPASILAPLTGFPEYELSGIAFVNEGAFLTLRAGEDTCLVNVRTDQPVEWLRMPESDVTSLFRLSDDRVAVAFTNRELVVFNTAQGISRFRETAVGELPVCMTGVGDALVWVSAIGTLHAWSMGDEDSPRDLYGGGSEFLKARAMFATSDEDVYLVAGSAALTFRISGAAPRRDHDFQAVFVADADEESGYYALDQRENGLWLIDGESRTESVIDPRQRSAFQVARTDVSPQFNFHSAVDSTKHLLISAIDEPMLLELGTTGYSSVTGFPRNVTSIAAHSDGGFWVADRSGAIHFVTPGGACRKMAEVNLTIVGRPHLHCWRRLLVWTATCRSFAAGVGEDVIYIQAFFETNNGGAGPTLKHLGNRAYAVAQGLLQAMAYDAGLNQMFLVWQRGARLDRVIKKGTPLDFLNEREEECAIADVDSECIAAALASGGSELYLLCASGNLFCLDTKSLRVQAILSVSAQVTTMAQGKMPGDSVAVVLNGSDIFFCAFQGSGENEF